ncbi:MAG: protein rep [Pseudomonadota bacterium]
MGRKSQARRHKLLRTAQSILFSLTPRQMGRKSFGGTAKKQHRTVWCHRHVVTEGGMPVFRQHDGSRSRLGKVKTCGSVWACPVCASKVAEQRRREIAPAMVKHVEAGGHAYLVTFTFPHAKGQALADLMEPFTKARQSFQNSRAWKAVMDRANKIGVINSLEVTYGSANGWHPHLHMLVFCDPAAFAEGPADEAGRLTSAAIEHLRGEWVRLLEKRGLVDATNRSWANVYSLDVRGGQQAAEYIAKWGHDESWGMSSELTSSHAKTGKRDTWGTTDHYTPFQLLALAMEGDGHAICAFREFVGEFDGRRMLTWSRGLKDHFGVDEVEDEEAAAEPELALPDEHQVGELYQEQLQVLVKFGRLGDFLAFIAEHGHGEGGQRLIDDWVDVVARSGGRHGNGNILVDRLQVTDYSYFHVPEEMPA